MHFMRWKSLYQVAWMLYCVQEGIFLCSCSRLHLRWGQVILSGALAERLLWWVPDPAFLSQFILSSIAHQLISNFHLNICISSFGHVFSLLHPMRKLYKLHLKLYKLHLKLRAELELTFKGKERTMVLKLFQSRDKHGRLAIYFKKLV